MSDLWTVECPTCHTVISVGIPLGTSIWRAKDKALIAHNREKHPDEYAH
jgi:hypothetical protein